MTIKLNKTQADILRHRLEVPDSVSDALEADYAPEDVDIICGYLYQGITDVSIDTAEAEAYSEGIAKGVLAECIEGSTVTACDNAASDAGEMTDAAVDRGIDKGKALAKLISEYVGRRLVYPTV